MNMNIVDRRPNPKGKSLSNRQRFLARARVEVKSAVQEALRKRKVADVGHGEKVAIPTRGISEPIFHHNRRTGRTDHVVPGNKEYRPGRRDPAAERRRGAGRPRGQPGRQRRGRVRVHAVEGRVPRHVLRGSRTARPGQEEPQGHDSRSICSAPATRSPARRPISACRARCATAWAGASRCRRPKLSELEALRAGDRGGARPRRRRGGRAARRASSNGIERRSKIIPYIDPIDVRYRRFDRVPQPNTEAVMFCLMDVSGSMTEAMKDLAKRFFMLLHVFLIRRYRHVDIVFIRHTSTAEEVDEETFFYSRETGGTVVSTALEKMLEIARARYPTDRWNIYARAGLGRRQLRRRQRPLRVAARRRGAAALPVFRLCRGRRRHGRQPDRVVARQRSVARL